MTIKKQSWIALPAYFSLSVGLVIAMSQTASAISIGPGSGLAGATIVDNTSGGGRTNISDSNGTAGTLLTAGTYDVMNFGYNSGANNGGTVQAFLATAVGEVYTPIWLGAPVAVSSTGIVTDTFVGEQVTLAADATVFAGFTQTGNALVRMTGSGNSDHNGGPLALTENVPFGPVSHPNIGGRTYAYELNLQTAAAETVPEPASIAIWSLLGLCLAGYGYRRRRRNS